MTQVDHLPRGRHIQARALQAIAATLRQHAIPTGTFHGADARQVCREHLLPALEELLRTRIQACQPQLVDETLRCLGAAHATRHHDQTKIVFSLAGPFADNWIEHALQANNGAAGTRPLEILFEFVLAHPPRGVQHVDSLEVADLAALAELLLITAVRTRAADGGLYDFTIDITNTGVFTFADGSIFTGEDVDRVSFDQHAYTQARRQQSVALARGETRPEPATAARLPIDEGARSPLPFTQLSEVADPRLMQADDLLRNTRGTGTDGVCAVLNVARDCQSAMMGSPESSAQILLRRPRRGAVCRSRRSTPPSTRCC